MSKNSSFVSSLALFSVINVNNDQNPTRTTSKTANAKCNSREREITYSLLGLHQKAGIFNFLGRTQKKLIILA